MGLFLKLRGEAASGNNKWQGPKDEFRKLVGLFSETQNHGF